jgi:hypothetical protein
MPLQYPEPTGSNSSATMNSSQSTKRAQDRSYRMNSSQSTAEDQDRSAPCKSTLKTTTTRKSSAYHRNFEQNLIYHGIYPNRYDYPNDCVPPNWKEIKARLAQPRRSLSPSRFSEGAFEEFTQANERALSKSKLMRTAFP